jgi:hypothetical protein
MKDADCSANLAGIDKTGRLDWNDAMVWSSAVSDGVCGLSDNSSGYVWRLPTRAELTAITSGRQGVLSTSMQAFTDVRGDYYWSSTSWPYGGGTSAWKISLWDGDVAQSTKGTPNYVWPVRNGP